MESGNARPKTSDEYAILIRSWFEQNKFNPADVKGVVLSSVVPNLTHSFVSTISKTFQLTPLILKAGVKTGIAIQVDDLAK